jgi:hypothetical protein
MGDTSRAAAEAGRALDVHRGTGHRPGQERALDVLASAGEG